MLQSLEVISVNLWDIIIALLNLTLLFLLVKKFLFKPVKKVMQKRQDEVTERYDEAAQKVSEADAQKKQWEEKMEGAEEEAASIIVNATETAKNRGEKIVSDAKLRADYIVAQAQNEADLRHKQATEDIKREIVEVSGALAEKMLEREINTKDHRSLIDSFIEKIGDDDDRPE